MKLFLVASEDLVQDFVSFKRVVHYNWTHEALVLMRLETSLYKAVQ